MPVGLRVGQTQHWFLEVTSGTSRPSVASQSERARAVALILPLLVLTPVLVSGVVNFWLGKFQGPRKLGKFPNLSKDWVWKRYWRLSPAYIFLKVGHEEFPALPWVGRRFFLWEAYTTRVSLLQRNSWLVVSLGLFVAPYQKRQQLYRYATMRNRFLKARVGHQRLLLWRHKRRRTSYKGTLGLSMWFA